MSLSTATISVTKKIGCCLVPIVQRTNNENDDERKDGDDNLGNGETTTNNNNNTLPELRVELPGKNQDGKERRSQKLSIGRNETTQIKDERVSRLLALLEYTGEFAVIKILIEGHELHLNDDKITESSISLREGDVLYLLSGKQYGYRVHYYDEKPDLKLTTKKSQIKQTIQNARHSMAEEFTCSICMEILVKSHVCHPCGHLFCESCIPCIDEYNTNNNRNLKGRKKKQLSCPTCRACPIKLSSLKALDNVIWTMTLQGGYYFSKDDVEHYLKRIGKEDDLTPIENDCIFGRFDKEGKRLERHKKRKQQQLQLASNRRKLHPSLVWAARRKIPIQSNKLSARNNRMFNNHPPNQIVDLSTTIPTSDDKGNTAENAICLD